MIPKYFENLPVSFQKEAVKPYYDILVRKKTVLSLKRAMDLIASLLLLIITSPFLLIASIVIKCTSDGPVFYRQVRIGALGKPFRIFKFRTMVLNADKLGTQITVGSKDPRITSVGYFLRKTRFDEFPQLLNILCGDMGLIGARPEVPRYVEHYTDEMMATLLLKPGVSGMASLEFKEENDMLDGAEDPEKMYIEEILPIKMKINLDYIKKLSIGLDIKILFKTAICIFK